MDVAPIVWINGFPGSGKLTIARELIMLIGADGSNLIDNHQLIDPVEARISRAHPNYQQQRKLQRAVIFDQYFEDQETMSRVLLFTGKLFGNDAIAIKPLNPALDFQSDNKLGREVAAEYKDYAVKCGRPFLPIYLVCELDENARRIKSPERANSGTAKLVNPDTLRSMRMRSELFVFTDCSGFSLDVTRLQPNEAARIIADHIKDQGRLGKSCT